MNGFWVSYIIIYVLFLLGSVGTFYINYKNTGILKWKTFFVGLTFGNLLINYYMCAFNGWAIAEFVVGGITLFLSLYGLLTNFVVESSLYEKFKFAPLFDLMVSIGLTVRLIYLVSDDILRTILIAFGASLYGGLITLAGVLLTLKHTANLKHQEEIEKNKPLIFPISDEMLPEVHQQLVQRSLCDDDGQGTLAECKEDGSYSFDWIKLFNADHSICTLNGYMVNDETRFLHFNHVIDKSKYVAFQPKFSFKFDEEIDSVSLLIGDMLSNIYKIDFSFSIQKDGSKNLIKLEGKLDETLILE